MGRFEPRQQRWWETQVVHCSLCGQMIPSDVWVADDGMRFCEERCEELYRSYWVPKYGPKVPTG